MKFDVVAALLDGIPNMEPAQGWSVYRHLQASGARDVLELGTGHGVSASYMAAALQQSGGSVTTVDHAAATARRDPRPADVIERAGLGATIERVLLEHSSYTWWLKDRIAERSDAAGNCAPAFDFIYIDGAHNWTIDGLAVFLCEKLLRPGGWLLLDDLRWSYGGAGNTFAPGQGPADLGLSPAEVQAPHMQLVFDLIVRQHPAFAEFRVENADWGWARKGEAAQRTFQVLETSPPLSSRLLAALRAARRWSTERRAA